MIITGDLTFETILPDVFTENYDKEEKETREKYQKAKEIEKSLKKNK